MDLELIRSQTRAEIQTCIAFTAILIWDWLSLLPSEIKHVWRAKRINPTQVAFVLNRYGSIILQTGSMAMIVCTVSTAVCAKIFWVQTLGLIYIVFTSDVLLALRISAMYGNTRKVIAWLTFILVTELALMIAVGVQLKPVVLPPQIAELIGLTGCLTGEYHGSSPGFVYVNSVATLTVNLILLSMTVYKSWKTSKELGVELPILRRLVRDGAQYFVGVTVANLVQLCFWSQHNQTIKSFGVSIFVVISSTLSCRLVLSLLVNKPSTALGSLAPISSSHLTPTRQHQRTLPSMNQRSNSVPVVLSSLERTPSRDKATKLDEEEEIEGTTKL